MNGSESPRLSARLLLGIFLSLVMVWHFGELREKVKFPNYGGLTVQHLFWSVPIVVLDVWVLVSIFVVSSRFIELVLAAILLVLVAHGISGLYWSCIVYVIPAGAFGGP